jgi:hypothetical protein
MNNQTIPPLDLREEIVRIDNTRAEILKLAAEQRRLTAE